MFWIIKGKKEPRWVAYDLPEKPELKNGYEMRGPYSSLALALVAAIQINLNRQQENHG